MNDDETSELLSAYLDDALPAQARRELEARLAASSDLRRELDELRAVSRAVKDLPRASLPAGFRARFEARRRSGVEPTRDWVFLPPALRPVALGLSCGVVAMWIWRTTVVPEPPIPPHEPAAKVAASASAPYAEFDLSQQASGAAADDRRLSGSSGFGGKQAPAPALRRAKAEGRPLSVARGEFAPEVADKPVMNEEARSARNEQLFGELEKEKKKMGIVSLTPSSDPRAGGGAEAFRAHLMGRTPPPPTPTLQAGTPGLLKKDAGAAVSDTEAAAGAAAAPEPARASSVAELAGRPAPEAGLLFADASSLDSAWVLLGLPGAAPTVDFTRGRALLLKPSATKILSVSASPDSITVVFRSLLPDEEPDPAKDRLTRIPLSPREVQLLDATPR